jgi:hypothetical protein
MRSEIGVSPTDRAVLDRDIPPPAPPRAPRQRKLDSFDRVVFWVFAAISMWVVFVDLWQVVVNGRVWTGTDGVYIVDQMQYLA